MDFCCVNHNHIYDICELENSVFTDSYSMESIYGIINNQTYKYSSVAVDKNTVRAYIIISTVLNEAEILRIAVDPSFRRKGFGIELLRYCINNLTDDNVQKIHLEVRSSNNAAIKLYEKLGFVQVGIRKGYYSDNNEDAILYTLELDKAVS